jgi:hypothetical protein
MASVVKSLFTKWVRDVIYALHEWDFPQTSAKVYKSVWRLWDVDEWDIPHAVDECEIPVRVLSPKCYSPEELTHIPKCFIPLTGFLKSRLIWNLGDKWTTFYVTSQNHRSCVLGLILFTILRFDFGIVLGLFRQCGGFVYILLLMLNSKYCVLTYILLMWISK